MTIDRLPLPFDDSRHHCDATSSSPPRRPTGADEHLRTAAHADMLPLLGVHELCEILGVGRTTVFEEIHAGELPAIKIHRRTLFDQRDIADYLERKRAAAESRRRSSGPQRRTQHGLTA